jgi:ADP-dependent NAD(P)H-hydrate dehydratase / NAD(P)H-hydrate epimerase
MKILTAKQMGEVDRLTSERYGIPSLLLMENAGRSVADELERSCEDLCHKRILILCGTGNNGGDGLVVARHLAARDMRPEVWILGDPTRYRGDALENWKMLQNLDLPVNVLPDSGNRTAILKRTAGPDVIVDALFGTGLSKPIGPDFRKIIDWINRARAHSFIASVDIPSGLFADCSNVEGAAVQADVTVTFTALKSALVFLPAADKAGRIVVVPIGSPAALLENPEYRIELIERAHVRRVLPARARDSHKGTFGHLFVIAGSRDKSGAALMTGLAAMRSGAGLVTLMLPKSLRSRVFGKVPELMTSWLAETEEGTIDAGSAKMAIEHLSQADAVVVGPGLSTHPATRMFVREIVQKSPVPIVLDADGINAFTGMGAALGNESGNPIIITPHPGEMARLMQVPIEDIQKHRMEHAEGCARKHNVHAVLKGSQTLIATPSGRILVNCTGNPGMATGGTGDILSGMMGRFIAGWRRKLSAGNRETLADFISAAVYLHGRAGDLAAGAKGEESMIATDLLVQLPAAFREVCCR